ncbi:P-loop containing nucleoside triphosphate hydrolase protein [Xylariaceae sp. FL0255]|nr:P-loop containing nucleoside triphosphate hydrolase protein [Xylariaceae sp. FL0255]
MEKYESIHGRDVSSFDLSSTHRLPTVSAAQALDDMRADSSLFLSTGLDILDRTLNNVSVQDSGDSVAHGGLQKGHIIEVWGPPGSGKSTFGMQIAARTLRDGCKVVWMDTLHPLCHERFRQLMGPSQPQLSGPPGISDTADPLANLVYYSTPTVPHVIALLCKPAALSIPANTSLIVIDGLSGLMNLAFPRQNDSRQTPKGPGPSAKRLQALQYIASALQKLAATRDVAILVLTPCATRMQFERGATIIPGVSASIWEQAVATRLVLFRDWMSNGTKMRGAHIVGVQKVNGQAFNEGIGPMFAFGIQNDGLFETQLSVDPPPLAHYRRKRKVNDTNFEIPDSEDEDYGWEDEDEGEMPRMPPQWQGSEDIFLGHVHEEDNEADEKSDGGNELPKEESPEPDDS